MFSIIICTYNRAKYIYRALEGLAVNDFPVEEYEIILVNNNSSDNTEEECLRFQQDYPNVDFLYFIEMKQGLSHARNRGIQESTYGILVFLDDDAFVSADYLPNLKKNVLSVPDGMAFGGKIVPLFESGKTPVWLSRWSMTFVSAQDRGRKTKRFTGRAFPIGANMGFRKQCITQVGLFNTELGRSLKNLAGGEEKDLFARFKEEGLEIYYFPDVEVQHVIPENRTTYSYVKKLGKGVGYSEYVRCKKEGRRKLALKYFTEILKWGVSVLLWFYYAVQFKSPKGYVLLLFRWNVTKGLLNRNLE
ncbi:glycosyltransferase family 2 protein [Paludibacter sp. 221]|uniref:glycosyltransferase n=1 Tax=Paludibacter sp. 221 TaxID=2302939 RepID=UPI0013D19C48|nr:glycosyltransferase [Paludibacter sp. 221]NDV46478.1 glycosyltransferase family 2 protein [Paludibacter sp. 221]